MSEPTVTRITGIAAGGAGVGRLPDGRAVFVHRTVPGEEVDVRVTQRRSRWARGRLVRIRTASPLRRRAPCPYYARCGGCTLEHMAYEAQLEAKASIVSGALERIGRLSVPEPVVTPSPAEFRYRNRVSFTLLRLGGNRVVAGFHELERPGRVLDVDGACLLPELEVARAWDGVRAHWGPAASRLPSGARLRVTVRGTAAGAAALLIEGGGAEGRPAELLERVPELVSIWHRPRPDTEPRLLAGRESLSESWADESLQLSGAVFLQVNRAAAARLEAHVMTVVGDVAGSSVVDAYCGVGLHARRLARAGARVIGIELDADAIREARRAPELVDYLHGPVETLLPTTLPADLVLLNPPRAGLTVKVVDALLSAPPARIIYISCDPATLARDLERLSARFGPTSLRCFDLFPQTAHVETVAALECVTS